MIAQWDNYVPIIKKKLEFWAKSTSTTGANMSTAILKFVYWLEHATEMHDTPHIGFHDFFMVSVMANTNAAAHYERVS